MIFNAKNKKKIKINLFWRKNNDSKMSPRTQSIISVIHFTKNRNNSHPVLLYCVRVESSVDFRRQFRTKICRLDRGKIWFLVKGIVS